MKSHVRHALLFVLLAACGTSKPTEPAAAPVAAPEPPAVAPTPAPVPAPVAEPSAEELPIPEDFEAEAEAAINEKTYKQDLAALGKEIEKDSAE